MRYTADFQERFRLTAIQNSPSKLYLTTKTDDMFISLSQFLPTPHLLGHILAQHRLDGYRFEFIIVASECAVRIDVFSPNILDSVPYHTGTKQVVVL